MKEKLFTLTFIVILISTMTTGCQETASPSETQGTQITNSPTSSPEQKLEPSQSPTDVSELPVNHITINGVEYSTSLTSIELIGRELSDEDIVSLRYMTKLTELALIDAQISDISPLADIVSLRVLSLTYTQVSDLTPLTNLINLEDLSLFGNPIDDISPLSSLSSLKNLLGCVYAS